MRLVVVSGVHVSGGRGRRWRAGGLGRGVSLLCVAGLLLASVFVAPDSAVAEPRGLVGESAAVVLARSQRRVVEVSELTSEWRRVVATPEGMLQGEYTIGVARVRDGAGGWRDPDLRLRPGLDGVLRPVASRVPITVSAGGGDILASIEAGAQRLALGWPEPLPTPTVEDDMATYAEVFPDVDLVVRVGADSLATYLVVKNQAAAKHPGVRRVAFGVESTGLSRVDADAAGGAAYRSAGGAPAFGVSVATMWDAAGAEVGAESSELIEPAVQAQVRKMDLSASGSELVVVPDAGFLDDPATVYPVTIDPVVFAESATLSQRVTQTFTQTNHTGDAARVGYNGWTSPYYESEMYYRFETGSLDAWAVKSMVFRHDNVHSVQHSPCDEEGWGYPIEVGITGWVDSSTRWSTRPDWESWTVENDFGVGHEGYCGGRATVAWDLTEPFRDLFEPDWFEGDELTVGMRAVDERDKYSWREFFNEFDAGSASRPLLSVEYAPAPDKAQSVTVASASTLTQDASTVFASTLAPTLQAVLPTTESCPAGPCQRAVFEVRTTAGLVVWSGASGVGGTGATVQAVVGAGVLTEGATYKVWAFVENVHYGDRSGAKAMTKSLRPWTTASADPTVVSYVMGAGGVARVNGSGMWSVTVQTATPYVSKWCWAVESGAPTDWDAVPSVQCVSSSDQQVVLAPGPLSFDAFSRVRAVRIGVQYSTGVWRWTPLVNVYPYVP